MFPNQSKRLKYFEYFIKLKQKTYAGFPRRPRAPTPPSIDGPVAYDATEGVVWYVSHSTESLCWLIGPAERITGGGGCHKGGRCPDRTVIER